MITAILLSFLFAAAGAAYGDADLQDIDRLIDGAPASADLPQAAAIVLRDYRTVMVDDEGRVYTRREYLVKLLDERAKDQYGDQSIEFDSDQDTVIIETAKTRGADGVWIDPEPDAFTLTSAREVQWASSYSQLKQQNVSFPGLDVGAAMYLVYRIEPRPDSEPPEKPHAGGVMLFGGYDPIADIRLVVHVPDNMTFQYEVQNSDLLPGITMVEEMLIYDWTCRDVEQIIHEPNSVGLSDLVPRVLWTTFADWEDLGLFVSDNFWEKVDTSQAAVEGFMNITSPELKGKPAIMNAALWVLRNIRNVRLSLGRAGYEPNTADRVWENRYGETRDKAVLLTALINAYGYQVIPVMVPLLDSPFSELPVLEQFRHMLLMVPLEEDTLWIDPMAENFLPGTYPYNRTYGKACVLTDGVPLLMKLPSGPAAERGAETTIRGVLNNDGDLENGVVISQPEGDRASRARRLFKDQKQKEREIYFQQAASDIGRGTLVTEDYISDPVDLTEPFIVRMGFESPGLAVIQDDLILLDIPVNPFGFALSGFYPALPEVRYPIRLPGQSLLKTTIEIDIPDGYKISYLPPPLVISNPYLSMELIPKEGEKSIICSQIVEFKQDKVPLADYQQIREAFQTITLPRNRLLILEEDS